MNLKFDKNEDIELINTIKNLKIFYSKHSIACMIYKSVSKYNGDARNEAPIPDANSWVYNIDLSVEIKIHAARLGMNANSLVKDAIRNDIESFKLLLRFCSENISIHSHDKI